MLDFFWLAVICTSSFGSSSFPSTTLNNGESIPLIGMGVGNLQHERIESAIIESIHEGSRLVDTAFASHNEHLVAKAVQSLPVDIRHQVVVVSKVWYTHLGYGRTRLSVLQSLENLRPSVQKIIMLLHWPRCRSDILWMHCDDEERALDELTKSYGPPPGKNAWKESWRALEDLHNEGLLQGIGVSNFELNEMRELVKFARVPPSVVQFNIWKLFFDPHMMKLLTEQNIHFQAYNALNGVLPSLNPPHNSKAQKVRSEDAYEQLGTIAKDHGATHAQVILKWLIQQGVSIVPRSSKSQHLKLNADLQSLANFDGDQKHTIGQLIEQMMRAGANLPPVARKLEL